MLVIEKTPLHSEQQIADASCGAVVVPVYNSDWDLQLELYVGQSVIKVEQRCVHLRFAWRAFQNEGNIDFPSPWRRRLRIIGHKWRTSMYGRDDQRRTKNCGMEKFHTSIARSGGSFSHRKSFPRFRGLLLQENSPPVRVSIDTRQEWLRC